MARGIPSDFGSIEELDKIIGETRKLYKELKALQTYRKTLDEKKMLDDIVDMQNIITNYPETLRFSDGTLPQDLFLAEISEDMNDNNGDIYINLKKNELYLKSPNKHKNIAFMPYTTRHKLKIVERNNTKNLGVLDKYGNPKDTLVGIYSRHSSDPLMDYFKNRLHEHSYIEKNIQNLKKKIKQIK